MTILLVVLTLSLLALGAVYAVVRVIDADGYGRRPAPRSHDGWGVALPSVPPASVYR
ncbi:hypothetical protein [Quadrisphaera sp. INWT6]|jgi:hypothetical protein|uniref:hypothetical protein n=1 Tax=Quadrisphaera sp. INWT6 TaxID=2596917 RepID=UPI0018925F79|nr:hypothetical protein [Quadrisphaera sp. INWT6]